MNRHSILYIFIAILFCSLDANGQAAAIGSLDEGDIKSQYDFILKKSNNYQQYKVVPKTMMAKFYGNIKDSLNANYTEIRTLKSKIGAQENDINQLNVKVGDLEEGVARVEKEKDSFSIFGLLISKAAYNTIMWGLVIALGSVLSLFVFRFRRSHVVTKKAQELLSKTKEEFDAFRKKTLDKEQKLMRELQDEINKNLSE